MQLVVTEEMNSTLSKAFTAAEIKEAIFNMNSLGSPRPDSFPTLLFQKYWDIVGPRVSEAILEV